MEFFKFFRKKEFENLCQYYGRHIDGKCAIDDQNCKFQYESTESCCQYQYQQYLFYWEAKKFNNECVYFKNLQCAKSLGLCRFQHRENDMDCSVAHKFFEKWRSKC